MDFAFPFSLDLSSKLWLAISAERLTAEDSVSLTIKRIRNFSLETCQVTMNLKAWKLPNENSETFPLWNIKKLWCSRGEITHRVNAQTKSLAAFKAFRLIICETNRIYLNDVSTITQQEKNCFYIFRRECQCSGAFSSPQLYGVLRRCPLAETKKGLRFPLFTRNRVPVFQSNLANCSHTDLGQKNELCTSEARAGLCLYQV